MSEAIDPIWGRRGPPKVDENGRLYWLKDYRDAAGGADEPAKLTLFFGEEAAHAPSTQDTVVRGIAHTGALTLLYGKPKSGKSFLATDLALAVADPERELWMGHRVQRHGPVLYVACEGHGGFWKRLQATGRRTPDNFVLACGRPVLVANPSQDGRSFVPHPDDIETAIAAVKEKLGQAPVMVIIDTVFRAFGSANVNDSAHMMQFVAACGTIAQGGAEGGIAVVCVHHETKANGTPNGSISLVGAADTIVKVERAEDKEAGTVTRTWSVEFAKDDAESAPRAFELQVIDKIVDAGGEEVSSCRVGDLGPPPAKAKTKQEKPPKPPKERPPLANKVWMMLREMVAETKDGAGPVLTHALRERLLGKGLKLTPYLLNREITWLVSHGDITVAGQDITLAS